MGHRTLVAYDRAGYDLHYAHWGVDPDAIAPETPFGGPPDDAWARRAARDRVDPEGGRLTDDRRTAVEPDPIATGLTFPEVCSRVDPVEHEALYLVDEDFDVRTYLVFALRRPKNGDRNGDRDGTKRATAALVGYDDETDAAYLRGWLAGARGVRDATGSDDDAVVRALRWLDPARGTLLWLAEEGQDGHGGDEGQQPERGDDPESDSGECAGPDRDRPGDGRDA